MVEEIDGCEGDFFRNGRFPIPASPFGKQFIFVCKSTVSGRIARSEHVQQNADGSTDIYFGPEAPEGKKANWIQTVPGRRWVSVFRVYSPLEPWFDKSWRPGEIELVE